MMLGLAARPHRQYWTARDFALRLATVDEDRHYSFAVFPASGSPSVCLRSAGSHACAWTSHRHHADGAM
jgi:hypothetical protein